MDKQKQKQIEEMTKELREIQPLFYASMAEHLYNAGYRKIPENAVVLTRDEFKAYSFVKEFFAGKSTKITAGELVRALQLYDKQARKETTEKFAERLKDETGHWDNGWHIARKVDEIAKEIAEVE